MIRKFSQGAAAGCMLLAFPLYTFAAHVAREDVWTWLAFAAVWSLIAIAHKD